MICVSCNKNKAIWVLDDDIVSNQFLLVCQDCLDEMIHEFGDIMLDYWSIELGDWKTVFDAVNRRIKYLRDMYIRALNGEFQDQKVKT